MEHRNKIKNEKSFLLRAVANKKKEGQRDCKSWKIMASSKFVTCVRETASRKSRKRRVRHRQICHRRLRNYQRGNDRMAIKILRSYFHQKIQDVETDTRNICMCTS
jgi:hypothetical protein